MQNSHLHKRLTDAIDELRSAEVADDDVSMLEIAISSLLGHVTDSEMPNDLRRRSDGIPDSAGTVFDDVQKLIKEVKYLGGELGAAAELRDKVIVLADSLQSWVDRQFGNANA